MFLIACTQQGAVSFFLKAWSGRISDVELVKESGFMEFSNHPRDQMLADRGFTLTPQDVVWNLLFQVLLGKNQLSTKKVETTRQIATIRIHTGQQPKRYGIHH